jgi:hypothetical protein
MRRFDAVANARILRIPQEVFRVLAPAGSLTQQVGGKTTARSRALTPGFEPSSPADAGEHRRGAGARRIPDPYAAAAFSAREEL